MHFLLLSDKISHERLSWIDDALKFFFMKLDPGSLLHHGKKADTVFTFLVTGDALYSFVNPETLSLWEVILSLPSVRIICDRNEMELRGISVERLKMKAPDQVVDHNSMALNGKPSFWKDVIRHARQTEQPVPSTIGYLQIESPYMHRSAVYALRCLSAAVEAQASIDLYTYLDGVHVGHLGQVGLDSENIGGGLETLSERATKRGLGCQMIACKRCSTARGYTTLDDGQGLVVSTCAIKPFKIREMNVIIDQFKKSHNILGKDVADFQTLKEPAQSLARGNESLTPPLSILVTDAPYGHETAYGAISLAVAAAHQGVPTQLIFIEEGVYALYGNNHAHEDEKVFNIQEIIDAVAGTANLQMYAYAPSLHQRGITKNARLTGVLDINGQDLGQILFNPSGSNKAGHHRIFFF